METTATAPVSVPPRHPKFVRWAVVLGIVIVLNVFFLVVRALVLPSPDYSAYCPVTNAPPAENAAACDALGGIWTDYGTGQVDATAPKTPTGYCDLYSACQPAYEAARSTYEMYAFALMVALGIIALIAGLFPIGSSIVSSGLSFGGVLALVIGSGMYWGEAGNWLRLAISVVALAALLYIGYKRFRD
jgi:hypothetical protein